MLIRCNLWTGLLCCVIAAQAVAESETAVDFAHDVVPIFKAHCVDCHGGREAEGGFSLNTRGLVLDAEAAVPGDAAGSRLWELVSSHDPEDQMPPRDRPRLAAVEIQILRAWIDQGLYWEPGFSFARPTYEPPLKPRRPQLPPVTDGRDHPIDRIIDAYLAAKDLSRPAPLGDAQFMRRLYFDLIGLPPTPVQFEAFLLDTATDKRARLVRQVLDNREAYATHWLSFWNDLLRNTYSGTGFIDGGRKQITGWLFRSLFENKPYDRFVRELVSPSPESEGFSQGIKWRGNVNASQVREVQFAQSVSQVFLGINMKCASCHDSFVDRWTLEETYNLAAVYATEPLELHRCDQPTGKLASAAWLFPELGQIDAEAPQPARLTQLAALMTHPQNGRLTRTIVNRLWHRLMGRGIVHPVDAMHTRPWNADLLDYLAVALADEQYDLKKILFLIATSEAYQSEVTVLDREPTADEYLYTGPLAKRLTAEQLLDAMWMITETWPAPDDAALRVDGRGQGGQLAEVLHVLRPRAVPLPATVDMAFVRHLDGSLLMRAALGPLDPLQATLGRPIREQVVTSRPSQFTTLEALTLANGPMLAETLSRAATNLHARYQDSPREFHQWLFVAALGREATPSEGELVMRLLDPQAPQQSVEDLLWALFMLPEFQLLR